MRPFIGPKEIYDNNSFTTHGKVIINFECKNPTSKIVFHAKELIIDASKFYIFSKTDSSINIEKSIKYDEELEFVTVHFNRNCVKNAKYRLEIQFKGIINDQLVGFYRSSYLDSYGITH